MTNMSLHCRKYRKRIAQRGYIGAVVLQNHMQARHHDQVQHYTGLTANELSATAVERAWACAYNWAGLSEAISSTTATLFWLARGLRPII